MAEGDDGKIEVKDERGIGICELCGEPMPQGGEMFRYHGHSGSCPKPPLKKDVVPQTLQQAEQLTDLQLMQLRAEKLSRVAHEIEAILVREDMDLGEWGEVVEMFSNRISQNVAIIKINNLD